MVNSVNYFKVERKKAENRTCQNGRGIGDLYSPDSFDTRAFMSNPDLYRCFFFILLFWYRIGGGGGGGGGFKPCLS